jgi:hypothetical protein
MGAWGASRGGRVVWGSWIVVGSPGAGGVVSLSVQRVQTNTSAQRRISPFSEL